MATERRGEDFGGNATMPLLILMSTKLFRTLVRESGNACVPPMRSLLYLSGIFSIDPRLREDDVC